MADTLREYLVSLGFRVDEASWKRYTGYLALAGKTTAELGSKAVESAIAVELAVAKVARQYESLYYLSERSGRSIGQIQSYGYSFRQLGLSADDATGAIDSLAETARSLPGIGGLFGGATDPQKIVDQLKSLPYFVAKQLAALRGLPQNVFQRLWFQTPEDRARAQKSLQDFARWQREAGVDSVAFGKEVLSVNSALTEFEGRVEVLGQRLFLDFDQPVSRGLKLVSDLTGWITNLDRATDGWGGTLVTLAGTGGGLWLVEKLLSRILGFGGKTIVGTIAAELAAVSGFSGAMRFVLTVLGSLPVAAAGFYFGSTTPLNADEAGRNPYQPLGGPRGTRAYPSGPGSRGDRNNNPGNIEYGPFAVAHGAIGTDGRFAVFPDKLTGETAMANLLRANYSGLTLAEIQRKWVGYSDKNYLESMERSTGLGPGDRPDVQNAAAAVALMRGMSRGEGTHLNDTPLTDQLSSTIPQQQTGDVDNSRSLTVNHKTDIHVEQGPTSAATAEAVMQEFSTVDQSTMRALVPVWR